MWWGVLTTDLDLQDVEILVTELGQRLAEAQCSSHKQLLVDKSKTTGSVKIPEGWETPHVPRHTQYQGDLDVSPL